MTISAGGGQTFESSSIIVREKARAAVKSCFNSSPTVTIIYSQAKALGIFSNQPEILLEFSTPCLHAVQRERRLNARL